VQIPESIFNHFALKVLVIRHNMYAVTDRLSKEILYSNNINQRTVDSNISKVQARTEHEGPDGEQKYSSAFLNLLAPKI
jgi:hypothetical protein